jgi:hypothetical protein
MLKNNKKKRQLKLKKKKKKVERKQEAPLLGWVSISRNIFSRSSWKTKTCLKNRAQNVKKHLQPRFVLFSSMCLGTVYHKQADYRS